MDPAAEAVYARVASRLPRAQFESRLAEARAAFDGLLDDEACAMLVLDELGLNEGAYATLADLQGRSEATVRVRVERVEPPRTFERQGRDPGRVANVVVSDATGQTRVVFWDRDVDRAEELRPGQHLTLVNARVKTSTFGNELHVGQWSVIEVEGALDPAKRKLLADVAPDPPAPAQAQLPREEPIEGLEGRLAWLGTTRPTRAPDGTTAFVVEADVETERGLVRIVAWNAAVKALRALPAGARVRVDALAPKVRGAVTEWHTTPETRIERA